MTKTISEQPAIQLGYMRVSKNDGSQSLDLQRDAFIAAGLEPGRLYHDLMTGRHDDRPGLQACLKALQPGNVLVVWKLDRLGRNLRDLVNMVDALAKRDIGVKVLSGQGALLDTSTAQGRLMFGFFAMLAEYERELIQERTKAGMEAARARGRQGGRPLKMTAETIRAAQALMSDSTFTVQATAKRLNVSSPTLYTYLNGDGSLKQAGTDIIEAEQTRKARTTRKG